MVLPRLIRSSSSRAFDCEALRAREIERRDRRLVARLVVVERLLRQQLALEQAARPLDVGLRQLQVGFALANRRLRHLLSGFGLLDLLLDVEVFDLGDALTAADAVAELHVDRLEAAGGVAAPPTTVASPIRLPTTVISRLDRGPCGLRELDRQRRPSELAAAEAATAAATAATAAAAAPLRRPLAAAAPPAPAGSPRPDRRRRCSISSGSSNAGAHRGQQRRRAMMTFFMTSTTTILLRRDAVRRLAMPLVHRCAAAVTVGATGAARRRRLLRALVVDERLAVVEQRPQFACSAPSRDRAAPGRRRSWWTGPTSKRLCSAVEPRLRQRSRATVAAS